MPGVYPRPDEEDNGEGVAASGTRTDAANYLLDGIVNRSDRKNGVGVVTSVEPIREFKVATSNYSAEFGRAAGAQVNVVSKSGTNEFHGSLFEYFRNDFFDAVHPITGAKMLRRNQFGGTLGGPVSLPRPLAYQGRDRSFFFLSYEGLRQRRSESELATAPNEAWQRGDFRNVRGAGPDGVFGNSDDTGTVIVDPLTGREFPTPNVIPADRFSPVSLSLWGHVQAANEPGTLSGYLAYALSRRSRNQYLAKIDHNITPNNNFYVRYGRDEGPSFDPFTRDIVFPGFGRHRKSRRDSIALSDTHVFSPRLINEARFGVYDQKFDSRGSFSGRNINTEFGIPGFEGLPGELAGFPRIEIDGFKDFGDRSNDPLTYTLRNYQFFDMVLLSEGAASGMVIAPDQCCRQLQGIFTSFFFPNPFHQFSSRGPFAFQARQFAVEFLSQVFRRRRYLRQFDLALRGQFQQLLFVIVRWHGRHDPRDHAVAIFDRDLAPLPHLAQVV